MIILTFSPQGSIAGPNTVKSVLGSSALGFTGRDRSLECRRAGAGAQGQSCDPCAPADVSTESRVGRGQAGRRLGEGRLGEGRLGEGRLRGGWAGEREAGGG